MPVIDHPVHVHGVRDANYRYGCFNREPWLDTVTVTDCCGREYSWPNVFSRECRYDCSLTDNACAGCKHAGSGERYVAEQKALGSN